MGKKKKKKAQVIPVCPCSSDGANGPPCLTRHLSVHTAQESSARKSAGLTFSKAVFVCLFATEQRVCVCERM